jgi:hypothetical protein
LITEIKNRLYCELLCLGGKAREREREEEMEKRRESKTEREGGKKT